MAKLFDVPLPDDAIKERNRVFFVNRGVNEYLDANGQAPPPPPADAAAVRQVTKDQYVLAKGTLNAALGDLPRLAMQARIVPSFKNGAADGFKSSALCPIPSSRRSACRTATSSTASTAMR